MRIILSEREWAFLQWVMVKLHGIKKLYLIKVKIAIFESQFKDSGILSA